MSKSLTKISAVGISIATAVSLSGAMALVPATAHADALSDLQAQIATLQAQLNAALASLAALGGSVNTAACTFTRSLTVGSTGDDVKCLQQYLNGAGHTLASSGAGSPGNETMYFGPLTRTAVAAWQAANGVAPAVGYFGPISRAKYDSLMASAPPPSTTPPPTTGSDTGKEATITVKLLATPPDLTEVKEGDSDVPVLGFSVKSGENGSTLSRIDLNFDARPWLSFNTMSIKVDGTEVYRDDNLTSSDFEEVTAGSDYRARISGLASGIPLDTTSNVEVSLSAPTQTESGAKNITIQLKANGIRTTDNKGLTQESPSTALTARTIRVLDKTAGNLEITANSGNPKERVEQVSTSGTTEIEVLRADFKATNANLAVSTVVVQVQTNTNKVASTTDTVNMYVDDVLIGSATPTALNGSTTFTDLQTKFTLADGITKTAVFKAVVKKQAATNYAEGATLSTTLVAAAGATIGVVAEDANYQTVTVSGSNAVGNIVHLYVKAPQLSMLGQSIASVAVSSTEVKNRAEGTITFAVKAVGGDIYLRTYSATAGSSGVAVSSTDATAASAAAHTFTSVADSAATNGSAAELKTNSWYIPSGQTKVFRDSITWDHGVGATAAFSNGYLVNVKWATTDAGGDGSYTTRTWGLTDFKTGDVFLSGS